MNIYIPFDIFKGIGGPVTFMGNLEQYLKKKSITTAKHIQKCGGIFFPIEYEITNLIYIKKRKGKIIQRLDGIYYPEKHGDKYLDLNDKIKNIYQNYSTYIIFQSDYSRSQCFALFGPTSKYSIIHNGANLERFYPSLKKIKNKKTQFITTGNFRNLDMLEPVIKALDLLDEKYQFELQVLGPIVNDDLHKYLDREYVHYLGESSSQVEISKHLRSADAFIYSHLNPPCPNSVIEAISTGLPVIGFDSGAMSELCYFSQDLLANVESKIFQEYSDFDEGELAKVIKIYLDSPDYFRDIALENCKIYSIDKCVDSYLKVFTEVGLKRESFFDKIRRYLNG